MGHLEDFAKQTPICRLINDIQTKDFPTPDYSMDGTCILGYLESDDNFRKRIMELINKPAEGEQHGNI